VATPANGKGSGGGGTFNIEVNVTGGGNAAEIGELVAAKLAELLEQIGLEQGAPA